MQITNNRRKPFSFVVWAVAASFLLLLLTVSVTGAQNVTKSDFSNADIAERDNLIVAQETLLNVFRCQFGVDTEAVSGGCADISFGYRFFLGDKFEGIPSADDITVRDRLIAAQETLLNTYRCRYGIDVSAVSGGCEQFSSVNQTAFATKRLYSATEAIAAGGLPKGLVTANGIPVAVTGHDGHRYKVITPCDNYATVSKGQPLRNVRVVIDPGHGGNFDIGALGPNGLAEKTLNLTLSQAVLSELSSRGITATTTRTRDYDSLLSVRAGLANALNAEVLVSIHHNGPAQPTGSVPGSEVFVQSESQQTARADSARLGGLLYTEITRALSQFKHVRWSRLSDAGVLRVLLPNGRDGYGMIRRPTVPAVLVEYGYLANPSEAALFATDAYINTAAKATANAIEAYLNTNRSSSSSNLRAQPRVFIPARAPSQCTEVDLE